MRIENGVAKLDGAQVKWDPPKPCGAGLTAAAPTCGNEPSDNITGETNKVDGTYYARENKQDIRLDADQNKAADALLAQARTSELAVSEIVKDIERTLPGSRKEGFGQRFKEYDSLKRKLFSEINPLDKEGKPLSKVPLPQALAKVNDSLRYTITLPDANYTAGVVASLRMIDQGAFKVVTVKNFWYRNADRVGGYPGINITVVEKATGLQFEIQFHTPDSYTAKTVEHSLYQQKRLPGVTDDVAKELQRQSDAIFGNIRTPQG